jgi:predicted MFS family arabinose efflux permease
MPGAARSARRRVLVASGGGFLGFYLELSVIPYIAAREEGRFAAGLLTFALMFTTVAMQAIIPRLLRRFSARVLFAAGLILIGAPTLAYAVSSSLPNLIAVTLVRGAGFGLITVMGSALTAGYAVPGARGTSLGAYGVATSIWATFAPAAGLAAVRSSSPLAVAALGALPPLFGLLALIPKMPPAPVYASHPGGQSGTVNRSTLVPPVVVFTAVSATLAAAFTFVPLLQVGSTPLILVLFGTSFASGRLLAGHLLDRGRSPTQLVLWLLVGAMIGLTLLGTSDIAVVGVGAAASGLAIGCVCTATLVMTLDRVGRDGVARASVIWNITYDVGQAVGAVLFGTIASLLDPSGVFLAGGALVALVALPAAAFDWRRVRPAPPAPVAYDPGP